MPIAECILLSLAKRPPWYGNLETSRYLLYIAFRTVEKPRQARQDEHSYGHLLALSPPRKRLIQHDLQPGRATTAHAHTHGRRDSSGIQRSVRELAATAPDGIGLCADAGSGGHVSLLRIAGRAGNTARRPPAASPRL